MRQVAILMICACLLLACTATNSTPGTPPTPLPAPEPGQGLSAMIGLILKHPERYAGQQVTLVGYFRGLDLLDESAYGPPINKSQDWVLKDDSGAIWVAHADKLPFSSTSHEVWRTMRVTGTVTRTEGGQVPYILPTAVEWEGLKEDYNVLPAFCRLAIHRFGGPNQLNHHIYWYEPDQLVLIDGDQTMGPFQLKSEPIRQLDQAFKKVGFFDLAPTVGQPCASCIRYQVAAVNTRTNSPYFVTLYEGSLPQPLQVLIDELLAQAANAKPG